eukprot:608451-Pyramimonas_sp.AAC.1
MGIAHSRCPRGWLDVSCLFDEQWGILALRVGRDSKRHRPFVLSCGPALVDLERQAPSRRPHQI